MRNRKSVLILLFLSGIGTSLFGETEWEMSRTRSRTTVSFTDNGNRLSVAVDGNGSRTPLSAQWSFSSPLFRAGGLTRSGFVSFFDNRNLSSEGKRNGVTDTWSISRTSSLTGIGAFGLSGAGFYAARHPDYLLTGISYRWEITDRISLVNACEWWGASRRKPESRWYHTETVSRETELFKSIHGIRYQTRSGHDAAFYASASSGNLNPATAALMIIYEYKNPLREFLFKGAWYGNGYLFKIQNPTDRTAAFFISYRENFGQKGYIRSRIGFDLPPVPDLFYILPFEIFTELRGEYRSRGWRFFAENRLTLNSNKEGDGSLKNRTAAVVSWQGMPTPRFALGTAVSARCTASAEDDILWKAEIRILMIYCRQGFSLIFSAEDNRRYVCGAEISFRLPQSTLELIPKWEWKNGQASGGLKVSVGI